LFFRCRAGIKNIHPDRFKREKLVFLVIDPRRNVNTLSGAALYTRSIKIAGIGRGAKEREETLEIRSLNNARTARAKKGKVADLGFKPTGVVRVE
jgi:topoisomerase IV subunit A